MTRKGPGKNNSLKRWSLRLDSVLNELNLLGNGRKLILFKSIELVEATPSAALVPQQKSNVDSKSVFPPAEIHTALRDSTPRARENTNCFDAA